LPCPSRPGPLAPGLLLLLSLPRPPGGSVLVSPLAQFSMSPDTGEGHQPPGSRPTDRQPSAQALPHPRRDHQLTLGPQRDRLVPPSSRTRWHQPSCAGRRAWSPRCAPTRPAAGEQGGNVRWGGVGHGVAGGTGAAQYGCTKMTVVVVGLGCLGVRSFSGPGCGADLLNEQELALLDWMHSEIDLIKAHLPSSSTPRPTIAANSSYC
jgi:hypothetical protein